MAAKPHKRGGVAQWDSNTKLQPITLASCSYVIVIGSPFVAMICNGYSNDA